MLAFVGSLTLGAVAPRPVAAADADHKPNACGCYRDSTGSCFCGKKKGKCACPGECEPKGCEEKRAKSESATEESASKKKGKEAHLTAAQKKELGHLLDAYLSEHPEGQSQTIREVRRTIGGN